MEKPWLAHYEKEVPHTIDYPKIPLHRTLEDSARKYPDQTAIKLVLRYLGPLTIGATLSYRQLLDQVNRFAAALARAGREEGRSRRLDAAQSAAVRYQLLRRAQAGCDRRQHQPHLHGPRDRAPVQRRGRGDRRAAQRVLRQAEGGAGEHADQARDHRRRARLCARAVPQHGQAQAAQGRADGGCAGGQRRLRLPQAARRAPGGPAPGRCSPGRHGVFPVHRRHHRRAQGRHAVPFQPGGQHRAGAPLDGDARRWQRADDGCHPVLSRLRHDGGDEPGDVHRRRRSSSCPTRARSTA